jgi:shikimate dehydrogenase
MMTSKNVQRSTFNVQRFSFGLIGFPLGHSLSPQIHGAALHALGINGEYRLYPVPPQPSLPSPDGSTSSSMLHKRVGGEGQAQFTLDDLLLQMRTGKIHGLNVTIPHKQNVIPLLDELTPAAKSIGAVNTIFMRDDVLIGDNTDAPGFWGDVQRLSVNASNRPDEQTDRRVDALVLGSGGGARAVVYALLTHGWRVTISARCEDQAQAETLKDDLSVVSDKIELVCLDTDHRSLNTENYSLLVNCTPVGMHPNDEASPWPDDLPLPKNAAVYDLVYNPRETLLVKRARAAGLPAATGLGMLVEQAALAFERWTGLEAPRDVMRGAVESKKVNS